MKSNYIGNKSDYNKIAMQVAREEVERQKAVICPECEKKMGDQVLAVTLLALKQEFGFGASRLQKVVDAVDNIFSLCDLDGKNTNATMAIDIIKSMGVKF